MTERFTRSRLAWIVATVLAVAAGVLAATAMKSSGAASQTVTLGSTSGTPNQNICPAGTNCTYLTFSSGSTPALQVPFDGTVTGFSVNSGSSGGTVRLRVLRPAGGGQYTGAGTSASDTLADGPNSFSTSLAVKAGDLLGLDNATSALLFDTSSIEPDVQYFQPGLADDQTGAPGQVEGGYRLLLSATVQAAATPTTTGTTPGTTGPTTTSRTTSTNTTPTSPPTPPSRTHRTPRLSGVHQSHASWSEPSKAGGKSGPVGTTFSFQLNEAAQVQLHFYQQLPGRRVGGGCVAPTASNHARRACTRLLLRGGLSPRGSAGSNQVAFRGRLTGGTVLAPGHYALLITATSAGRRSGVARLAFTILASVHR
ncbi:MAG: hypothetical protein JOZ07_04255 [Solirubrobacterales bacterium]|nr:hypothetical protein [Solirubrobacterales bacterium]